MEDLEIQELKGSVAYRGLTRGTVKIVNTPKDVPKVQEGDVVVSVNGTPSLMLAMIKSKAIITDEGGLTCHASILSREWKIPALLELEMLQRFSKMEMWLKLMPIKELSRRFKK